ncbi:MAG: O-antigen ligase family protein [Clostridiales bacterium]|nr:O-antigen ligase family protein [Clostridiales bacterium]
MKEKILKHINRSVGVPEFISGLFVILMLTVQLFAVGPQGYANITIVKYISFLAVSGAFAASMLAWGTGKRPRHGKRLSCRKISVTELCVLIYFAFTVISALVSEFFPDTLIGANRREGALTIGIYCFIFLLLSRNLPAGKWIVYLTAAVMTVYSLLCILQLLKINALGLFPDGMTYYDAGEKYSGEFLGTLGNAGLTASLLCLTSSMLLIYISRAKERARYLLAAPVLLCMAVLMLSRIAAGILGFFAGIFISLPFVFGFGKKTRNFLIIAELLMICFLLAAVYRIDFESGILYELHSILHGNFDDSFGTSRIFIWRNTLPLIPSRPLLGGGPDTLAQRIGVIFETAREDGTVKKATIDAAHNEYLNIAVCQGIPALIAYLAAVISTLVRFVKSHTDDPIAAAFAVGIVCYCVQAFFGISMFISTPYFWIFWALLKSRLRYLKEKKLALK